MDPIKTAVTKKVTHALEDAFDIESGTTEITTIEHSTELVETPMYDAKDSEIEAEYQGVLDKAMGTFERLQDEMDGIEGRYLPRLAEVSAQFLNLGLNVVKEKARLKEHKDKLQGKKTAPPTTVNQNLFIERNELLQLIRDKKNNESQ